MPRCEQERIALSDIAMGMSLGRVDEDLVRTTLLGLAEKGETVDDVMSFAVPYLAASIKVSTEHPCVLDMCGTGGAPFRTFNVSTLASVVVSACGVPVAKHGNRSSNGKCGSADLMEALGYDITSGPDKCGKMLDDVGFAFLFAPRYHPAMMHVSTVRRALGRRTVFNILGPLMNPVLSERRQLVGVGDPKMMDIVADVLSSIGVSRFMVVNGTPGMDEVSTLGPTMCIEADGRDKKKYQISPEALGIKMPREKDLEEKGPKEAALIANGILDHEVDGMSEMVSLNAACGLYIFGAARTIEEGLDQARKAMMSGRSSAQLERIISMGGRN